MRISHDLRKMAKEKGKTESEVIEEGMKQKSKEFIEHGSSIYQ